MLTQPIKFGPSQLAASAAAIYTSGTNLTTTLTRVVFTNVTAGALTFSVYVVRSGDTAAADTLIIDTYSLSAHEAYTSPELAGLILNTGDAIHAVASSATSINVTGSGYTS